MYHKDRALCTYLIPTIGARKVTCWAVKRLSAAQNGAVARKGCSHISSRLPETMRVAATDHHSTVKRASGSLAAATQRRRKAMNANERSPSNSALPAL